jgi:lipid-A-disaccharide synthase
VASRRSPFGAAKRRPSSKKSPVSTKAAPLTSDIFMSAGEASGDLEAALLLHAIRELRPGASCTAIGGERLRAAGASLSADSSDWASIGPVSAFTKIPKLYVIMRRHDAMLRRDPPRVIVPIDFGAFNLRLVQQMRRSGYRGTIIYYFPPGAWLDSESQARAVAQGATPLTGFVRQRDFYARLGLRCEYFGHPLVSAITPRAAQEAAWPAELRVTGGAGPRIVVFPGSRAEEIDNFGSRLASAAALLAARAQATFVVAAASTRRGRQIERIWPRASGGMQPVLVHGAQLEAALGAADAAWTASGTAVLENALREIPQVAFYAITPTQYRIAQKRIPQFVRGPLTLPNLLLGRTIVPELLQDALTPDALASATIDLLSDDAVRASQIAGYRELRAALGPPDALARIARFVVDAMDGAPAA